MNGVFGNTFDFNRNGNIDPFERAAEYSLVNHILDENDKFTRLSDKHEHSYNSSFEGESNTTTDFPSSSSDIDEDDTWLNDSDDDDFCLDDSDNDNGLDDLDDDDWPIDTDEDGSLAGNYDFSEATDFIFNKKECESADYTSAEKHSSPEDDFGYTEPDFLKKSCASNVSSDSKVANVCDESTSNEFDSFCLDSVSSGISPGYARSSNIDNRPPSDSSDSGIAAYNNEKYPLGSKLGYFKEPIEKGSIVHPDVKVNLLTSLMYGVRKIPYEAHQKMQKAGALCFKDRIKLWEERRDYLLEHHFDFDRLSKMSKKDALDMIKQAGLNPYDYWDMF